MGHFLPKDANLLRRYALTCLRWATAGVFLGRAWKHLYRDGPYRTLLWDEDWMSPVVAAFGYDWTEWVTSTAVDNGITLFANVIGVFFAFGAMATLLIKSPKSPLRYLVQFAGAWLVVLALLATKERFYHVGQFFEYALQMGSPFFFLLFLKNRAFTRRQKWVLRIAIALTFTCHGLYAAGYYPRPGNFLFMVMSGLGLSDSAAVLFLNWAGILDFIAAFCLLIPVQLLNFAGLIYTIIWGFLTTIARVWSYLFVTSIGTILVQWLPESVLRLPHFLIPLALWFIWVSRKKP